MQDHYNEAWEMGYRTARREWAMVAWYVLCAQIGVAIMIVGAML